MFMCVLAYWIVISWNMYRKEKKKKKINPEVYEMAYLVN